MNSAFVVVVIAALAAGAQADNKEKLIPKYIQHTLGCMKEKSSNFALCKEMSKEGNDNTDAKYEPCKCAIACVAKKAGVITESGDADLAKFTAAVDEFDIPEWSAEWKRVQPLCEPVIQGKKECELAYAFFTCGYEKSEIFRGVLKQFLGAVEST